MHNRSWVLGHFKGIPIRLHPSLLLILPLLVLGVASLDLSILFQRIGVPAHRLLLPPLAHGFAMAMLLFASVLLHEMGHAAAAVKFGLPVGSITLLIFGGATEIDQGDATPTQALGTALAGPVVNLIIGVSALLLARLLPSMTLDVKLMLLILGVMNIFLMAFNLVPAFPLDGGRALQAILQLRLSDARASYWTAQIGKLLAFLLGCFAVYIMDLMLLILSVFLYFGAESERNESTVRGVLSDLVAEHAISKRVIFVEPHESITAVAQHMLVHDATAAIVEESGRIYGVVLPEDLRGMNKDTIGCLVDGAPLLIHMEMPLREVARKLHWTRKSAIALTEDGRAIGVVTNPEIVRATRLKLLADQSVDLNPQNTPLGD
jgi:Zn-dependent protease